MEATAHAQAQQLRLDASGMTFAALSWSPPASPDGPLALCLHGYPDTARTWRHLGPHLAERGWRVVAPYMRGYAPTDLASGGTYQIGALVRDVEQLHAALGADERAVLIGHDWGAVASYATGSHAPGLFRRVVTLGWPPGPALFSPLRSPGAMVRDLPLVARQLRCSWYMFFQSMPGVSERVLPRLIPRLWADWAPGYDAREDLADVFAALDTPQRRTAALRYYRALLYPWLRRRDYAHEQAHWAGTPAVPTLYLHGAQDGCALAAVAERARGVLAAGSRVEILAACGHFPQLERPAEVNERIAAFIEEA